ncbi:MAG: HD domain-containing protein [Gallionellaceae bacterium]
MPSFKPVSGDDLQYLLDNLPKNFSAEDIASVQHACELVKPFYADKVELTNAPLLQHALGAAATLAKMNMDRASITAVILHALPEYLPGWAEKVHADFGNDVCELVEGISRMEQIRQFSEMGNLQPSEGKNPSHHSRLKYYARCCLPWCKTFVWCLSNLPSARRPCATLPTQTLNTNKS